MVENPLHAYIIMFFVRQLFKNAEYQKEIVNLLFFMIYIFQNRNGKISRKELRNVMDKFKIKITGAQFKELMIVLDPQHTNVISYHKFLDLFEPRETKVTTIHIYNI